MNKAYIITKSGGYSRMELTDVARKELPGDNDVIVHVHGVGVNYADCLVRLGLYKSAKDQKGYPIVPGFDFAGEIKQVGRRVSEFKIGDRVFGVTLFGAYQEELVANAKYLYMVPDGMTYLEAASLPTAFLTARYIFNNLAHAKTKESIFIRSIAGGVGSWLKILATSNGLEIYGTVSTKEKRESLIKEGFKNIFIEENEYKDLKFDIIANAHGGKTIYQDFKKLNKKGRLVLYGFHGMVQTNNEGELSILSQVKIVYKYFNIPKINPFSLVGENKSVHGCNLSYLFSEVEMYRNSMDELIKIISTDIKIPKVEEIPFDEATRAHYLIEHGKTVGKLVLAL